MTCGLAITTPNTSDPRPPARSTLAALICLVVAVLASACVPPEGERTDLEITNVRKLSPASPAVVGTAHGVEIDVRNNGDADSLPFVAAYKFGRATNGTIRLEEELNVGPWSEGIPAGETKTLRLFLEPEEEHVNPPDDFIPREHLLAQLQLAELRTTVIGGRRFRAPYQDSNIRNHIEIYSATVVRPANAVEIEFESVRINGECFTGELGQWGFSFRPWIQAPGDDEKTLAERQLHFPGPTAAETRTLPRDRTVPVGLTYRFDDPNPFATVGGITLGSREPTANVDVLFASIVDVQFAPIFWGVEETRSTIEASAGPICDTHAFEATFVARPIR